jgi:hypothetical protein
VCEGSTGDPCAGPDGDEDCAESCNEASQSCDADDPDGSACPGGTCAEGMCTEGEGGAGGDVSMGGGDASTGGAGGAGSSTPSDGGAEESGGCAFAPGSDEPWSPLVLLAAAWAFVRRRARERGGFPGLRHNNIIVRTFYS